MRSQEKYVSPKSEYYIYAPSKNAMKMFFYPLQCGHFIYEAGYSLNRSSYDSFLLMYIHKGQLSLHLHDQMFPVTAGQFVFLDCYQSHGYSSETGYECLWCHFDGVTARAWYDAVTERLGNIFSLTDPQPALNKFYDIYNTFHSGRIVLEPLMNQYLTDILTAFLLGSHTGSAARPVPEHYARMSDKIITYINEHFTENITTRMLAEEAGLSQYHFIRTFKKQTGFTPHEYIVNIRITTAKYLLKNTQMSVKDICFNSGFSCESVFCNAFKHNHGMTPAQYRSMASGGPPSYD